MNSSSSVGSNKVNAYNSNGASGSDCEGIISGVKQRVKEFEAIAGTKKANVTSGVRVTNFVAEIPVTSGDDKAIAMATNYLEKNKRTLILNELRGALLHLSTSKEWKHIVDDLATIQVCVHDLNESNRMVFAQLLQKAHANEPEGVLAILKYITSSEDRKQLFTMKFKELDNAFCFPVVLEKYIDCTNDMPSLEGAIAKLEKQHSKKPKYIYKEIQKATYIPKPVVEEVISPLLNINNLTLPKEKYKELIEKMRGSKDWTMEHIESDITSLSEDEKQAVVNSLKDIRWEWSPNHMNACGGWDTGKLTNLLMILTELTLAPTQDRVKKILEKISLNNFAIFGGYAQFARILAHYMNTYVADNKRKNILAGVKSYYELNTIFHSK